MNRLLTLSMSLMLLLASLACNLPYGIGLSRPGEAEVTDGREDGQPVAQEPVGTPTATPSATYLPTFTPTSTPEPTPTATRVVLSTSTPVFAPVSDQPVYVEGTLVFVNAEGTAIPVTPVPSGPVAPPNNVFVNGSFDDPWPDNLGIAPGWNTFDNGEAHVGWYKDTWSKVVYDGAQAQLIEIINDQGVGDRYAGIYQTVQIVPGAEYELVIHGLVRSDEGSEGLSGNGYALQYGIDYGGGGDWLAITEWVSLPFPEHPREDPAAQNVYNYGAHALRFRPPGPKLTLFIRGWKRWPDLNEANFDVDAISLHGAGGGCVGTPAPTVIAALPPPAAATLTQMPTALPPTQPSPPTATATPTLMPGVTPTPGPTETPTPVIAAPTATFTPAFHIPDSGGELPLEPTPLVIIVLNALSLLLLVSGAVWGVTRRRT